VLAEISAKKPSYMPQEELSAKKLLLTAADCCKLLLTAAIAPMLTRAIAAVSSS